MESINSLSRKQIIGIVAVVLIMVSVAVGVYLVQRQQNLKSKASTGDGTFVNAFEIKDANGNLVTCNSGTNPPTCTTNTLNISVRVKNTAPLLP